MRRPLSAVLFALVVVGPAAPCARAEPAMDDYRKLNAALVERHVVPRYKALTAATAALSDIAEKFCAAPDDKGLAALKAAFQEAVDAWQGIQHVRFGPIDLFMRSMRVAFWPDPRDTGGRQLDQILTQRDRAAIDPKGFGDHSVAVQGLPAMERLLYDEGAAKAFEGGGATARFRCAFAVAVSKNIAKIAADVLTDWTAGDPPFAKVIVAADGPIYRTPKESTLELFKALHTAVELVADHKLKKPMGPVAKRARPSLAESWRSGHSLENIRVNLAAAEAMYLGEGEGEGGGDGDGGFSTFVTGVAHKKELDDLLRRAFKQTRATAAAIEGPLKEAILAKGQRPKVEQLQKEAAALKQLLARDLTEALGIPLGFNALDGD